MAGERAGHVDEMHQAAAKKKSQRVGVIGQNNFYHLRLRLTHWARQQIAVTIAQIHGVDSIKRASAASEHALHILLAVRCVPMSEMNRVEMLTQFLRDNPNDSFARYGLAMEYSKAGDTERAMQEFGNLLAINPDYTAGYFMAAQTLARAGKSDEARKMLTNGIVCAARTGNAHAKSEMEAFLEDLSA
jgi:tetratricopeptide (TPR) repeat protein